MLRVHAILNRTRVLGPGERFALWLQGCEKDCSDCMSQSSRNRNSGTLTPVEGLVATVLMEKDIEGITISGGEPFLQYKGLLNLLEQLHEKSTLSVIIYTGYYLPELRDMHIQEIDTIINELSDIIIDGPYINELNDGRNLRGSSNQTVHLTSSRYVDTFSAVYDKYERACEIHYNDKEAFLAGIPDENGYKMWQNIFSSRMNKNIKHEG